MMASKKHGNQSAATSPSTTQGDLTQPLTAAPRIKPTLTRCRSARQHNPRPTIHLTTRKFCSKDRGHFSIHPIARACPSIVPRQTDITSFRYACSSAAPCHRVRREAHPATLARLDVRDLVAAWRRASSGQPVANPRCPCRRRRGQESDVRLGRDELATPLDEV